MIKICDHQEPRVREHARACMRARARARARAGARARACGDPGARKSRGIPQEFVESLLYRLTTLRVAALLREFGKVIERGGEEGQKRK
jgi:hypothetical protein